MSLTGGHLDAFLAAGLTAEQIVALVKADIEEREKVAQQRRDKDAERQRRHRESRDVTVTNTESQAVTDKGSPEVSPPAPPLPNPSKQSPLSPPVKFGEKRESVASCLRRAYPADVELPVWMPAESYAEFRAMRKAMRNVPFGPGAERRVIAKITKLRAEGHDPEKLLSKAIERGHRSVFEDETTKAGKGGKVELSAQQLRERAEWFVRHGQPDRADECRQKAVAIEQRTAA